MVDESQEISSAVLNRVIFTWPESIPKTGGIQQTAILAISTLQLP
jgi:hypothetical protein